MIEPVPPAAARPDAAILIVDDAPASLTLLRKMMSQQGYQTFVATSGERALQVAKRVHPDLILLDVVMPGLDGYETCRRLKANPGTARIPVIFMSAKSETDAVLAGFDVGAVDYITKPLRLAEVCVRVRTQLQIHSRSDRHQEQADRLRTIVEGMSEGLLIIEASGRIQYTNPACNQYLGYDGGQLGGMNIADLLNTQTTKEYFDFFASYAADPQQARRLRPREVALRHREGMVLQMDLALTPMMTREPLFIGLLHDISHHKQFEDALQKAAHIDPLTKIANRRHFDTFLDKEWHRAVRNGTALSLVVLDVDHFKLYNDSLGHPAGDACLQRVADAIQAHAMRGTDLAARYGGEEFVLLFAETPADKAVAQAEAIRQYIEALNLPHPKSATSDRITVSIGVATIEPTQLDDLDKLFVAADRAMYVAKEEGRNRVCAVSSDNSAWDAVKALVMR